MTPNHPIPPERIRAEAERVVNEWGVKYPDTGMWQGRSLLSQDRFVALVAAGVSLVDVSAVQREAARKAWDAAMELARNSDRVLNGFRVVEVGDLWVERDRYLAREHPAPAPRECVLSDGSVVTRGSDDYYRRCGGQPTVYGLISRHWVEVLRAPDLGADFDKLKAFAERAK